MKRTHIVTMISLLLCVIGISDLGAQTPEPMPYFNSFENTNDTAGWMFKRRPRVQTNWSIGDAAHRIGAKGLYVSADDGMTASYVETGSGYSVVAYRKFTLTPGTYELSFDCRVAGEAPGRDALRVGWMPTTVTPTATSLGATFPTYVTANPFINANGVDIFEATGWTTHNGTINVVGNGATADYYLAFVWKTNGGSGVFNPGACVDNIQIAPVVENTVCHAKPSNITQQKTATDLVISWQGNATSYELMYFNTTSSKNVNYTVVPNIIGTSYSIPFTAMQEGVYSFRVRSICSTDTSMWISLSDVLHYDPNAHCLDYLNFYAAGVTTTVGTFNNPYQTNQVVDHGYDSKQSMHTVHYLSDEYDLYTGYQLKTVPDGTVASVRLSNWTELNSPSGSITYTYTIGSDVGVLLLNYAAVLQYADHHPPADQTRITVEILDAATGQLLDPCTYANFNSAQVATEGLGNWNEYNAPEGLLENQEPILWSNWRTIGINVAPYVGRTVKIRLTLQACVADYHFAYAYFTLDCNEGKMEGITCGEKPDTFEVTSGFDYRWYKEGQPLNILGNGRKFGVSSTDTFTYCVDMISTEDPNCYFTLKASALPRYPVADMDYEVFTKDCRSYVAFHNKSKIVTKWEGVEKVTDEKCTQYEWDLGKYGTTTDIFPDTLIVPIEGDTFNVTLKAMMEGCDSTQTFVVEVPATGAKATHFENYICEGTSVTINGKQYSEVGEYTDTLSVADGSGCDSVLFIKIDVLVTDTIISDTTICDDQTIVWFGQDITTTGQYTHAVKSVLGCDSLYYIMTATINETLELEFGADTFYICADEPEYLMPYTVNKGNATGYKIKYSSKAESVGFESDVDTLAIDESTPAKIVIPTAVLSSKAGETKYIETGYYQADVTFYNSECGNVVYPVTFGVEYPSFVIAQRWNDVLAMKNDRYNGGYKFASYQWYKNSGSNTPYLAIDGETESILYIEGQDLDFNADYLLQVVRMRDGKQINTCPVRPVQFDEASMQMPEIAFYQDTKTITSASNGTLRVYTITGVYLGQFDIVEGENIVDISLNAGVYIFNIVFEQGNTVNTKIMVR